MTQEIACCTEEGVVVATDSLVIYERDDGHRERLQIRKLFPVGQWAVITSAGASIGIDLSQQFARYAHMRGIEDFETLSIIAQYYLAERYGRWIAGHRASFEAHPQGYRRLYFLLAGYVPGGASPGRMTLFQSEDLQMPFQQLSLANAITVPRRIALEAYLVRRVDSGASLNDIAVVCRQALEKLAQRDPDQVGGPFSVIIITADGSRLA